MKKVLVIDDDAIFQKTISAKLTESGFEPILATDGEDGLVKVAKENPDIILLDLNMPKLDGVSFLKQFNFSNDGKPKVPVLITSNLSSMQKISEGIALGVRGYILKSNETLDTIVKEVQNVIG